METKINKTYILSFLFSLLLLYCGIYQGRAQEPYIYGKRIVLEQNNNYFEGTYIARDMVSMREGFKCTSFQSFFRATLDEFLIVQKDDYEFPFTNGDITINTGPETPIGKLDGSAGVGADGSANYTIPIITPTGIGGLQPNLSISYNSNGGNGLLGLGWNLNGLSVITRVAQTPFMDGVKGAVMMNSSDRAAIDGVRIVEPTNYWEITNSYRTMLNPYSVISYQGTSGFSVLSPEGTTSYYGATENSQIRPTNDQNAVLAWYVSRVQDKNGNFILFNYRNYNNELVIDNIEYTGNVNIPNFNTYNKIQFYYEKKRENVFSYVAGGEISQNLLLTKIKIFNNNNLKGEYQFTYSFDMNLYVSKLKEVKFKINNIAEINSTKIVWDPRTVSQGESLVMGDFMAGEGANKICKYSYGDFNGDGKSEIFKLIGHKETINEQDFFYTERWKIFAYETTNMLCDFVLKYDGSLNGYYIPMANAFYSSDLSSADFNDDGKQDIIINVVSDPGTVYMENLTKIYGFNDGSLFSIRDFPSSSYNMDVTEVYNDSWAKNYTDINGDGKADFFKIYKRIDNGHFAKKTVSVSTNTSTYNTLSFPDETVPDDIKIGDVNGNGVADFLFYYNNIPGMGNWCVIWEIHKVNNGGLIVDRFVSIYSGNWSLGPTSNAFFADFNGDGKSDYLYPATQNNNLTFSKGYSQNIYNFETIVTVPSLTKNNYDKTIDMNGDGYSEIVQVISNNTIRINSLKNSLPYIRFIDLQSLYGIYPSSIRYEDFNGDGIKDIFAIQSEGLFINYPIVFISNYIGEANKYVESVYDGYKNRSQFNMQLLTKGFPFYIKYTTSDDNEIINVQPPMSTVSKLTISDKNDTTISEDEYTYEGLKYRLSECGLLGFIKINKEDKLNNIKTVNTNGIQAENNKLKRFLPLNTSIQSLINGHYEGIKSIDNIYNERIFDFYPNQPLSYTTLAPYVEKSTVNDMVNNVITVTEYHPEVTFSDPLFPYGCRTDIQTINVYDENINNTPVSTTTKYTGYAWTHYCYELKLRPDVSKTIVTKGNLSNTRYVKNTYNTYDTPLTQVIDPDKLDKKITTTYSDYDLFGNCRQTTVTTAANDFEPRITKVEYESTGRFINKSTNPMNQITTTTYNAMGQVLSSTDFNNHITTYEYDALDRPKKTIYPDGNYKEQTTSWVLNNNDYLYKTQLNSSNEPTGISYYDCLGRVCRNETTNMEFQTVLSDVKYNPKGQVEKKSLPYIYGAVPLYVEYLYDHLGRLKQSTSPDGTTEITTYGVKTVSVALTKNGHTQTSVKVMDALGLTAEIRDNIDNKVKYDYNELGLPIKVQVNMLPATFMTYYYNGCQETLIDPDAGTSYYEYYSDGMLKSQKNAKNVITTCNYDKIGRILKRTVGSEETNYEYDNQTNGNGLLKSVTSTSSGSEHYYYDNLSRLYKSSKTYDGQTFDYISSYNEKGQLFSKQYPGGFGITYHYQNGYVKEIKDQATTNLIWEAKKQDNFGTITEFEFGDNNRTKTTLTYNPTTHLLEEINTGNQTKQWWQYEYDEFGNMTKRWDRVNNKYELFAYDGLQRLGGISGPVSQNLDYYDDGRINYKTSVGTYGYNDPLHFHAVTEITNGPLVNNPPPDQTILYTNFDKVSKILQENKELNILYGTDQQRIKSVYYENDAVAKTKYFLGNYEKEVNHTTNTTREINYINSPSGLVAINIKEGSGTGVTRYVCTDHQGSIMMLINQDGSKAEEYSYDAWGRRRNPDTWHYTNIPTPIYNIDRGYTGHEHLDAFGLINMNGRFYDPVLGRMLSPDNYVQASSYSQSFDRYGYCMNNPLKYTDPTGECWNIVIGAAIGAVVGGIYGGYQAELHGEKYWSGFWKGAAVGAVGGAMGGAFFTMGAYIGVQGVAAGMIYGAATGAITGAVTGGLNSSLNGGSFSDGAEQGAKTGALMGALSGGISGGRSAYENDRNIWWGTKRENWAYKRNQWSFAWWDGKDVAKSPIEQFNGIPYGEGTCVPTGMAAVAESFGQYNRDDPNWWIKEYEKYSGNKWNPKAGVDLSDFECFVESEGYDVNNIVLDKDIYTAMNSGKRVVVCFRNYSGNGDGHLMVVQRVEVFPDNNVVRLTMMNPNGGQSVVKDAHEIRNLSPVFYSISK